MTEARPAKSPNFIRDQFILTVILIGALVCRSSIVSSKPEQAANDTNVMQPQGPQSPATQPHAIDSKSVVDAR